MKNYPRRPCILCGYEFVPRTYKSRFCSGLCEQRWYAKRSKGGQHSAPIGSSTADKSDHERDAKALEQFNKALQRAVDAVDWAAPS